LVALCLAAAGGMVPAMASGIRTEFGLGLNGLLGLRDFGEVSDPCVGGDAALHLVHEDGGFGARVAGGVHLLQGYSVPTGELIYNGTGTQPGKFEAKQSLWWVAIGPAWTGPLWSGRLAVYLMAGRAIAKASSGQGWMNTQGADPGSTHVAITRAGAGWSPAGTPVEIGAELLMGGRAAFWGNPPAIVDNAGNHVLRSRSVAITGAVLRLGYHVGR
jgi:hypothetical protein